MALCLFRVISAWDAIPMALSGLAPGCPPKEDLLAPCTLFMPLVPKRKRACEGLFCSTSLGLPVLLTPPPKTPAPTHKPCCLIAVTWPTLQPQLTG